MLKRPMSVAALTIVMAGSAQASDVWANKEGVVGLGADSTLGGIQGLSARYNVMPELGLLLTLGYANSARKLERNNVEGKSHASQLGLGLYGSYKFIKAKTASMSGLLGLDLAHEGSSTDDGINDPVESSIMDVGVGLGLLGEVWVAKKFSLFTKVGLSLDPVGKAEFTEEIGDPEADANKNISYGGMDMTLGGGLFGGAGFTVWFD